MGKGAYTKSDCLSGSKSMSSAKFPSGSGKMSSAHAVVPAKPTSGMHNAEGRLGSSTRCFSNKQGTPAGKK